MKFGRQFLLGFSLLSIGASATALAIHESPGRRTCRELQGGFYDVVLPGASEDDDQPVQEITLCRFGELGVDSESLYRKVVEAHPSIAVSTFLSLEQASATDGDSACSNNGGTPVHATSVDGTATPICQFSDGSLIDSQALVVGSGAGAGGPLATKLRQ